MVKSTFFNIDIDALISETADVIVRYKMSEKDSDTFKRQIYGMFYLGGDREKVFNPKESASFGNKVDNAVWALLKSERE